MNDHITGLDLLALNAWAAYSYYNMVSKPVTRATRHANLFCGVLLAVSVIVFFAWTTLAFGGAA